MRTIFHSTEAATDFSMGNSSSPWTTLTRCRPARRIKLLLLLTNVLAVRDYECFASSVSVPYVFGECAMRRIVFYSFDCITLFNFTDILLTFWLFFIQIVK